MSPKWKLTIAAVTAGYVVAMSPIFVGDAWTDRTKALVGFAGVAIAIAAGRPLICHERSPFGLAESGPSTPRQGQMRTHSSAVPAGTVTETDLFNGLPEFDDKPPIASIDTEAITNGPDRLERLESVVEALDGRLDQLGTVVADQSTLMATGLANLRREVQRLTVVDDAA